jgi:LPXTG-motif cell wall-anchored protein
MSKFFRALAIITFTAVCAVGLAPAAQALSSHVTSLSGYNHTSGVAYSLDGALAYLVESDDGTLGGESAVSVIDTRTLENLSGRIPAGQVGASFNHAIAMSPDGSKAYVSLGGGQVKPFYPATRTFGPAISLGTSGIGQIVFTPNGALAYAAVANNGSGTAVKVIDVATDSVVTSIPVGTGPSGLAITPDGLKVFVNCSDGTLQVIETASNTVVSNVKPTGHLQGTTITMAPDGSTVYVTAFSIPTTVTTVIDTTSGTELHQFTDEPKDVAFSSDSATAYLFSAGSGDLVPTNPATFAAGTPIDVTTDSSGDWFLLDKNPVADQFFVTGGNYLYVVGDGPALPDTGLSAELTTALAATATAAVMGGTLLLVRRRRA